MKNPVNELKSIIKKIKKTITLDEYKEVARLFQESVNLEIDCILKKHSYQLNMEINGVEICYSGSPMNTSTAFGFIVEAFILKHLSKELFLMQQLSTTKSIYDFRYMDDNKIELFVNLKVEKDKNYNYGIVAGNLLKQYYIRNEKPKLYLITKVKYHIDEQHSQLILSKSLNCIYLESFIT